MSSKTTYPRPTTFAPLPTPLVPRTPPIPLQPPPLPLNLPSLPPRPPLTPPSGFISSSHFIPAAHPRQFAQSTGNLARESEPFRTTPPKLKEGSEERKRRVILEAKNTVRLRFEATPPGRVGKDSEGAEKGLWLAVQRWSRDHNVNSEREGEGLTLVITHANGFHKEAWLPTLESLLTLGDPPSTSSFGETSSSTLSSTPRGNPRTTRIDEIYLIDDVHHAASVDLNKGVLGPVHSWPDSGRDIINLIEHLMPDPGFGVEGEMIPWKPTKRRRKVIGIGHSVGGNAMVHAAHARPDLFHGLFLVEPMCPPLVYKVEDHEKSFRWPLVAQALRRRSSWPSREEAAKSLRPSPFFASWHQKVFDLYISHALVPVHADKPEGAVQLATPPWCEAAVFAEPTALAEAWDKLPELEVPVGFVMAGDAKATLGEDLTREMVWRPKRSKNERMMDAGHLVVQEKPDEVADALWRFIGGLMGEVGDENARAKL